MYCTSNQHCASIRFSHDDLEHRVLSWQGILYLTSAILLSVFRSNFASCHANMVDKIGPIDPRFWALDTRGGDPVNLWFGFLKMKTNKSCVGKTTISLNDLSSQDFASRVSSNLPAASVVWRQSFRGKDFEIFTNLKFSSSAKFATGSIYLRAGLQQAGRKSRTNRKGEHFDSCFHQKKRRQQVRGTMALF